MNAVAGRASSSVVVIGSSNTDLVVTAPKIPSPGETVLGDGLLQAAGGKGANQAVAAARLGAPGTRVTFVGKHGNDDFGRAAHAGLEREGIDVRHFTTDPNAPSGVALITVDPRAENAIVVASGANLKLSLDDIDRAWPEIEAADVALFQLESPLDVVQKTIARIRESHPDKTVILNPAPAQSLAPGFLRGVTILTPNETEAAQLTGLPVRTPTEIQAAADALHQQGVRAVILTLGEKGAFVSVRTDDAPAPLRESIAAPRVNAIDTTAAGDVFTGALASELASGTRLFEAVKRACQAASVSVTRRGAQPSIPRRTELG